MIQRVSDKLGVPGNMQSTVGSFLVGGGLITDEKKWLFVMCESISKVTSCWSVFVVVILTTAAT